MASNTAPLISLSSSSGYGGGYSNNANYYSEAQELANAAKLAEMYSNAINTQYSAGIQNLQDQKEHITEVYNPYRNQVNNQAMKSYNTLSENMANLNLDRSGHNLTMQTAIETNKQRNLQSINTQEQQAARDLQAQINEYIAQRDAAIANQTANVYQTAYNNISSFNQNLQIMATQHGYDKEMSAIQHNYNKEMAAIEQEYKLAYMHADYGEQARLQKEMAGIEQSYNMQLANYKNQLDMQSYNAKAATDWNYAQKQAASDWDYYQKQAALQNSYSTSQKKISGSTGGFNNTNNSNKSKSTTLTTTLNDPMGLSHKDARKLYNDIAVTTLGGTARGSSNPTSYHEYNERLDKLYDSKRITQDEFIYLANIITSAQNGAKYSIASW